MRSGRPRKHSDAQSHAHSLSAVHTTPVQVPSFIVFEFCRDDKKTCVSTADPTETLQKLKGRCCKELDDEVFRLGTEDHDALVTTKTKVMKVAIGPGDVWTQSYESCKGFTVEQIVQGLGTEERRQMPIQLKFTMVNIGQTSETTAVYDSDTGVAV